ncbi:glutathione synthetase [Salmonella enterica subsp. enterica]|uniref:Glutathione synthetase n=1 Tax=Salmonella enterica I TaxID=59201 RepID=A0A379WMX6_SALET|nr:glutathione synthetase [Salmonella enterica subsp. enterica]
MNQARHRDGPIAHINIKKDTSFAMLLEAQRRGYELHYMEMADLYLINGEARARTRTLRVEQNYDKWYEFGSEQEIKLADLDVILMRKDPPFDTEFIYATYILERAEEEGTLIVNKPQSLRDCNEKLYTAWFSDLTPETLVTRNKAQLKAFWEKHGDIIMKPLDGMGGASIFRVKEGDPNIGVIAETLTELGNRYCMAQNYLPRSKMAISASWSSTASRCLTAWRVFRRAAKPAATWRLVVAANPVR